MYSSRRAPFAGLVTIVVLIFLMLLPGCWYFQSTTKEADVTIGEVVHLAREGQIKKIQVEEEQFTVILNDGRRLKGRTYPSENLRNILQEAGGVRDVDALFNDP